MTTPPNSQRVRLNRGIRLTEEQKALAQKAILEYRPLIKRELKRLPDWVKKKHLDDAYEKLMVEVMWATYRFDPKRGPSFHWYVCNRIISLRASMPSIYASQFKAIQEGSLESEPIDKDAPVSPEDLELVCRILENELNCFYARKIKSKIGTVLEERYLQGLTLQEMASRRGVTKEAIRLTVLNALQEARNLVSSLS